MKVYYVDLYEYTGGIHLQEEKLFSNAKAAKADFEAVKRRLPQEDNRYAYNEQNNNHFTEYYTKKYGLMLGVKDIILDKPMSGPPSNIYANYLKKNTLVEHLKYVANKQRSHEVTFAKLYDYMKYYCEDAFIDGKYEKETMTFRIMTKDCGILTIKAEIKPDKRGFKVSFS